ncbi:uncharacterized protein Eint_100305 [Encephalitozoon intestinalis ATCC 50506]|uniref:Uncharacterized protein n=1 Tax=Encephalitozoon intestinalis (strain ATCC 50506) TaxID=876142 RepID=W8P9D9_ENCIT|nr:uncharacterized protein Eint_100305 [Encephalitozoon intestinalis ATCC 50506]AHL30157.1 hypothetical protein Eint_100305 [Encephalitozoon intestinalis ATCC 50506]UTX46189.1 hypothetical protein GPK93_10g17860 [Encephalitozoon intestinalis]
MPRKVQAELQECIKEIEKVIENSKTPKERITLKRKKMERLGGHVKKYTVPLNRIIQRIETKKASAIAERERLEFMGISKKKRKKR